MKKLVIFIIISFSFATNNEVELFSTLFPIIFNKNKIKIYTTDLTPTKNLIIVNSCKEADIVLGKLKCNNKPHFYLNYYTFKKDKSINTIGAFYWRKGRPQLRLLENSFIKYHLFISPQFKDYLE